MSTLMEKDVLIEEVSAVAAFVGYRFNGELPSEFQRIAKISDSLYCSDPEQIDAEHLRAELADIKKPFLNKPIILLEDPLDSEALFQKIVNAIYTLKSLNKSPCKTPFGAVLGGQPGAAKSVLSKVILEENPNIIVINGDEFRPWFPNYETVQKELGKDSVKATAQFAGKVTEAIIRRALNEHYNVVIEGTFRTSETPLKTLSLLKDNGYKTAVYIKTCDAEISWSRCNERYETGLKNGEGKERYTPKEHHDLVASILPDNSDIVYKSGLADRFVVIGENKSVFYDSDKTPDEMPSKTIKNVLNLR